MVGAYRAKGFGRVLVVQRIEIPVRVGKKKSATAIEMRERWKNIIERRGPLGAKGFPRIHFRGFGRTRRKKHSGGW